jgi:hypothetical protein
MILAIDFDGVIHDDKNRPAGKRMGPPIKGAKEALLSFRSNHHSIIIHTLRATSLGGSGHVRDWLVYFGIPFDDVVGLKPAADVYIDDKAITFRDWSETISILREHPKFTESRATFREQVAEQQK